ncbi:MAG: hypothetical protein ACK47Y_01370 [Dolichospermum sp.]
MRTLVLSLRRYREQGTVLTVGVIFEIVVRTLVLFLRRCREQGTGNSPNC